MNNVRYYYGQPLKLATIDVLLNEEKIIGVDKWIGKARNVPRVTICGIYDEKEHEITFGVTVCSEKDKFVKKTGRELSYNRATTKPYLVVPVPATMSISECFLGAFLMIEAEVLKHGISTK